MTARLRLPTPAALSPDALAGVHVLRVVHPRRPGVAGEILLADTLDTEETVRMLTVAADLARADERAALQSLVLAARSAARGQASGQ